MDVGDRTEFEPGVAMLGDRARCVLYLPFPNKSDQARREGCLHWVDPRRRESQADNTGSILERIPRLVLSSRSARRDGPRDVRLRLGTERGDRPKRLKQALEGISAKKYAAAFLMGYDMDADSAMLWSPSQPKGELHRQSLVRPDATNRTMLNFVLFASGQPEDVYKYVEDGVAFLLTDATWQRVESAVEGRLHLEVLFRDGTTLHLERADDPMVLGRGAITKMGSAELTAVSFFTSQIELEKRVDHKEMLDYVDGIMKAAGDALRAHPVAAAVDLRVDIEADARGQVLLPRSYRPATPVSFDAAFEARISKLPVPRTRGPVKIGLDIHLAAAKR